jgi:hypothetical protein
VTYPIFINNRDRLTMTRRLAEQCAALDDVGEVVIVDNGSTYPPLLDWYETCPFQVIRLAENRGTRGVWTVELPRTFYVETDGDLDLAGVPRDLLPLLQEALERWPEIIKVGTSLEIDGIPDVYPFKAEVLRRESQMWRPWEDARYHSALIDTTFAMYRAGTTWGGYGPALRTARPYTAIHTPWHVSETF